MLADVRIKELKKLLKYAQDESEVSAYGIYYQWAAIDLKTSVTKMIGEINKYQIADNDK
jgi:hypothetical protein